MKIGYACIPVTTTARTTRKLTLNNYNEETLKNLIQLNLLDLKEILKFNKKKNIYLFRISSDIIPLGSHSINNLNWSEFFKKDLLEIGEFIKRNNMRVSMHPGQYTVLNSPKEEVVKKSLLDIEFHCNFLDSLKLDYSHKIIIHIGGIYGDKETAIKRFVDNFYNLSSSAKKRLIIENDERNFSIDDVLHIASIINIPVVFDNLHNECNINKNNDIKNII
ncbi:MAG: UV DNA damage repair endonuclease UvsE, partial [Sarcina sp.]